MSIIDIFSCVISTLCVPDEKFQRINPTTQVALFALCLGQCSSQQNITWNVYQGSMNTSSNITQWILFNQMNIWRDLWFFGTFFHCTGCRDHYLSVQGTNTSNFTSTEALFLAYPQIHLWKFEVVYSFPTATSSSALNFLINQPPSNGSCSIGPSNGTNTTPFNVSCPDWFDQDEINDYSLYRTFRFNRSRSDEMFLSLVWSSIPSERTMIAYSSVSTFQVLLPSGIEPTFALQLIVYIRDRRDCITEWNLTSIVVRPDSGVVSDLMSSPWSQLLLIGNPNTVAQVINSVSQQCNQMNTKILTMQFQGISRVLFLQRY
jgi:hypothetical protein